MSVVSSLERLTYSGSRKSLFNRTAFGSGQRNLRDVPSMSISRNIKRPSSLRAMPVGSCRRKSRHLLKIPAPPKAVARSSLIKCAPVRLMRDREQSIKSCVLIPFADKSRFPTSSVLVIQSLSFTKCLRQDHRALLPGAGGGERRFG